MTVQEMCHDSRCRAPWTAKLIAVTKSGRRVGTLACDAHRADAAAALRELGFELVEVNTRSGVTVSTR